MLVLSRRAGEKIVFPGIGTTVQVVASKPGVVRLGIEAPPEVVVLRAGLLAREGSAGAAGHPLRPGKLDEALRRLTPAVRNRLSAATVGLALLRRQRQMGLVE